MRQNSGMVARARPLGSEAGLADKAAYGSRTALEDVVEFARGIAVPAGIIALVLAFLALVSGRAAAADAPAAAGKAAAPVSALFWSAPPAGVVQGGTDFGTAGYGGPCPPPGKAHHYHFRIFALKVAKLDVPADATAAMVGFAVNANKLAEADLVGLYGR